MFHADEMRRAQESSGPEQILLGEGSNGAVR